MTRIEETFQSRQVNCLSRKHCLTGNHSLIRASTLFLLLHLPFSLKTPRWHSFRVYNKIIPKPWMQKSSRSQKLIHTKAHCLILWNRKNWVNEKCYFESLMTARNSQLINFGYDFKSSALHHVLTFSFYLITKSVSKSQLRQLIMIPTFKQELRQAWISPDVHQENIERAKIWHIHKAMFSINV